MTTLVVVIAIFVAGAVVTFVGARLIARAHPPRGRFLDVGGLRQHVVELGGGATDPDALPVVLIHGAGANLEDMDLALSERLAGKYRVILVDRPGFGWSERKAGEGSSPAVQAVTLREVMDRLGIGRAIMVGHSWGGTLALTFALEYPQRAAGLVLVAAPTHPLLGRFTKFNTWLATPLGSFFAHTLALPFGVLLFAPGVHAAFLPQRPPRRYVKRTAALMVLRPASLLANWADVAALDAFLKRQVERYGGLATPTIAIVGDRDLFIRSSDHSLKLAAAAPVVELVSVAGFGHMLHYGAADRVAGAVEELAARAKSTSAVALEE